MNTCAGTYADTGTDTEDGVEATNKIYWTNSFSEKGSPFICLFTTRLDIGIFNSLQHPFSLVEHKFGCGVT